MLKPCICDKSYEEKILAIKQDGLYINCVKNQTEELCLLAVKQNGNALCWIKPQTPIVCIEAINQNPNSLCFVDNQTPELCIMAVKKDYRSLYFVRKQTIELCLEALKISENAIYFMKKRLFNKIFLNRLYPSVFIESDHLILSDEELIDPISYEVINKGSGIICAFLFENGKHYLVGTLDSLNTLIYKSFQGSNKNAIFVPIKNQLISTKELIWVKF